MLIPIQSVMVLNRLIPFEEKMRDHNAILNAYLDSHVVLNHSDRTLDSHRMYLRGWFTGYKIHDDEHPDGRQLFVWEAMHPIHGAEIVQSYAGGLAETDLLPSSCRCYLGRLNCLFKYVCSTPYIPAPCVADAVLIRDKYNDIANPVTKYIYPSNVQGSTLSDFLLVEDGLNEFLSWICEYVPKARNPIVAGRTYTQIVTAAECGFRYCELKKLDALAPTRDIFPNRNSIRTRFGKASKGSGPRVREVEMTPLARATLAHYESRIRPRFPGASVDPSLFLTETGIPVDYQIAKSALETLVRRARAAGLILPDDMGWHCFRRSFATQFIQRHPDKIWKLLRLMGQQDPFSLFRYVRPSPEKVNEALGRILQRLTTRRVA